MQERINNIEKNWHEINVDLVCADFLGAHQGLRKMILQLKLLKLRVGILMDLPYPQIASGLGEKKKLTEEKDKGCCFVKGYD